MRSKWFVLLLAAVATASLWGCGGSGGGGSDVPDGGGGSTPANVGSSVCLGCHDTLKLPQEGWYGSFHEVAGDADAGCEGCHGGGQYHQAGNGNPMIPVQYPDLDTCATCHDVTTRHINGDDPATSYQTTPSNPLVEGYTKVDDCLGCHSAKLTTATQWQHNPSSTEINHQWANSAHAGRIASATPDTGAVWGHYDWDAANRQSCQRCHTATGAMNFLNAPGTYNAANNDFSHLSDWTPTVSSPQNELLYCWGCHSDVASGTLRAPGAITEVYDPLVTVAYPDAGKSNICMGCHLGREVGAVVKADADPDGTRSFINSHYLAAGATVYGESGYEYDGQDYTKNFSGHASAGSDDGKGPCVTCHMTSGEPHAFEVVEKDAGGVITGIATTSCDDCHGNMNAAWLVERKESFHHALDNLNQALEARGIYFYEGYPYFFNGPGGTGGSFTTWGAVATTLGQPAVPGYQDVMGAAFNFNLFEHDPGAYAHNSTYVLKLIGDSIDYLADGLVDGAGVFIDFPSAGTNSDLLADVKIALGYTLDEKHFGGAALVQANYTQDTVAYNVGCGDCHASSTTSNGVIIDQFAEAGHGDVFGEAWMHYDWRASNRGTCQRCHTATGFVTKLGNETNTANIFDAADVNLPGEVLRCSGCHTDVATGDVRTPGQFTETYNDGQTFAFPDIGKSNLCIRCHSGRDAGSTIVADPDLDGVRSFINSHYLTAGGTVFATTGYEYTGVSYANVPYFAHANIGIAVPGSPTATDAGPCAGCHMGTGTADHTWDVVGKDADGVITSINSNTCGNCHAGAFALTPEILETEVHHFHAALDALKAALEARGIYYFNGYPYFFAGPDGTGGSFTDWASVAVALGQPAVPGYKDVMGAAFNYNLLHHDPGAYAHNRFYTKRLIFDAIDFLEDGALDGTISVTGDAATYLGTTRP